LRRGQAILTRPPQAGKRAQRHTWQCCNFEKSQNLTRDETMKRRKRREHRHVSNLNEITAYAHCGLCLDELPPDQSPMEYARLNVGMTPVGFQVWCVRHDVNVLHIDFEGHKHPVNATRHTEPGAFGKAKDALN
jgi:hypothetical protein